MRSIKSGALSLSQSDSSIGLNNSHPRFPAVWSHCNKFSTCQSNWKVEKSRSKLEEKEFETLETLKQDWEFYWSLSCSQARGRVSQRRREKQQAQDEIEIWSEPHHLQLQPVLRLQPSLPSRSGPVSESELSRSHYHHITNTHLASLPQAFQIENTGP